MEVFLPLWREGAYAAGTPVRHTDGQDYIARLTHDSTGNALWNPAQAPSLFRLLHMKQPERAKPYVAPVGDTNIYHRDECMLWTDGAVYISTMDNNGWTPNSYAAAWRRA